MPITPLIGTIIDRWGTRRIAIGGTILSALAFAGFGLADGSITQWLLLWSLYAVVLLGVQATVWSAAVSGVFSASRGLALGVTISGAALAQIAVPPLAYWLIERIGWRLAYAVIGIGWGAAVLLLVLPFLFDAHDHRRAKGASRQDTSAAQLPGITIRQALRSLVL